MVSWYRYTNIIAFVDKRFLPEKPQFRGYAEVRFPFQARDVLRAEWSDWGEPGWTDRVEVTGSRWGELLLVARLRSTMPATHVAVGVDATPDGWVAVRMHDREYARIHRYADDDATDSAFRDLWTDHRDADVVLVDVPIGLPEDVAARAPERAARGVLGPRSASVFNVPIRPILHVDSYADANDRQKNRERDGRGLMKQTFNIVPRIREVDDLLGAPDVDATQDVVREAHPEVCFRALNDGVPMAYSKTAQPAAAHWERVGVLASVHANDPVHDDEDAFHDALATAGRELLDWDAPALSNDDLLDAFALAVTGSTLTGSLQTLPDDPAEDDLGRRMEMAYATPP